MYLNITEDGTHLSGSEDYGGNPSEECPQFRLGFCKSWFVLRNSHFVTLLFYGKLYGYGFTPGQTTSGWKMVPRKMVPTELVRFGFPICLVSRGERSFGLRICYERITLDTRPKFLLPTPIDPKTYTRNRY